MQKRLVVVTGPDKDRVFVVNDPSTLTIGRGATTETKLVDLAVSRNHCELLVEGGRALLRSGETASGTFVNGEKIATKELRSGDLIRVGDTELRFDDNVTNESTIPPVKFKQPVAA